MDTSKILQKQQNSLEEVYRSAQLGIRPLINAFVHKDQRMNHEHISLMFESLNELENRVDSELNDNPTDVNDETKAHKQAKQIFDDFYKLLTHIIDIADRREALDFRQNVHTVFISLREFLFFTSAVSLGLFASIWGFNQGVYLLFAGVVGLFLYFFNDITKLARLVAEKKIRKPKLLFKKEDFKQKTEALFKRIENKDEELMKEKIRQLERIIASGEPQDTLDVSQALALESYYIASVLNGKYEALLNRYKEGTQMHKAVEILGSIVRYYLQLLVISMVTVDANRPAPQRRAFYKRFLSLSSAIKFVGYVMLNALSFNLFYNFFVHQPYLLLGLNIAASLIFSYVMYRFERYIVVRELQ